MRVCFSVKTKREEKRSLSLVVRSAGGSSGQFFLTVPSSVGLVTQRM